MPKKKSKEMEKAGEYAFKLPPNDSLTPSNF
jgi:hypothetical protein